MKHLIKTVVMSLMAINTFAQQFSISPTINVSGNADESVLQALPSMIVDTIQNASFNGLFNPAVSNVF